MNRFSGCKTLGDLYTVFNNADVFDYNSLTQEELDRVATVFEANIPDKANMPDRPLTKAGYELIWNVTIETVEAFINRETVTVEEVENMEEEDMKNYDDVVMNEEVVEEVTMGEKAKAFAEASKEKLADGLKFVVENVDVAADEVKKMANMSDKELESYLKNNGKSVLDKIVEAVKKYSGKMKENADVFPSFKDRAEKSDNIVELIKDVLDEEELSGWGKFKAIVKEIVMWLLRLLLKIGAIVLKIAFTIVVGTIKIGATALVTAGKTIGVVNKEIVQPTVKAGKKAWTNHKARKAEREAMEENFDDIEEELFDGVIVE